MNISKDDILSHRLLVYGWAFGTGYGFEVRCIDPNKAQRPQCKRYICCERDVALAADDIAEQNALGYNLYATVNALKSGLMTVATDEDVAAARYHVVDADKEGVAQRVIQRFHERAIIPAFTVVTGTKPFLRAQ